MIPVLERAKKFHALDLAAKVSLHSEIVIILREFKVTQYAVRSLQALVLSTANFAGRWICQP
jgi:hypothetical protein